MRRPKIETDDERSERIIRGFCQRFCESYWRELDAKRTARLAEIQPPDMGAHGGTGNRNRECERGRQHLRLYHK